MMKKKLSFENALKRLEEIVGTLESGNITLEESLIVYQEGVMLSKLCNEKLKEAEGKVMKVINKDSLSYEEFSLQSNVEER